MLQSIFDALPSIVFAVDDDVRIQAYNARASELLSAEGSTVLARRAGEVLHCLHANDVEEGCGWGPACKTCIVRGSVNQAFLGNRIVRQRTRLEIRQGGQPVEIFALITASPFSYNGENLVLLVIEDITEIAELRKIVQICLRCKKIRDEKETWRQIESYFKEKWDVDFSHGLCEECYRIEMDNLKKALINIENTDFSK